MCAAERNERLSDSELDNHREECSDTTNALITGQYSSACKTPSPLSSSWQWGRRPIRPLADGNNKQAEWFWRAFLSKYDGRVGQICAPIRTVHQWDVEHQVCQVAPFITKTRSLRHHVGHRAGFQSW